MTAPYYADESVTLYLGDCREILPELGVIPDLVIADPPYAETSYAWDRWPEGWAASVAATGARSLWCFGSLRMFLDRRDEFTTWQLSHDVVWEKHNGSGFVADRFKRVHEQAVHWYRGPWAEVHHNAPREATGSGTKHVPISKGDKTRHTGTIGDCEYIDDGSRIVKSVIRIRNMHHRAIHPTEKPLGILDPLIQYGSRPGDLILDPFAGSGSTLDAARCAGRRAIGIELHEPYAEAAARRLGQGSLFGGAA